MQINLPTNPRNRHLLAIVAVLLLGALLFMRHAAYGLPYLENPDEGAVWSRIQDILGNGRTVSHYGPVFLYPITGLYSLNKTLFPQAPLAAFFFAARLTTMNFATLALALVYATGKRWGGHKTGLVAALLFATLPQLVTTAHLFKPEVIAMTFALGSLWAATIALDKKRGAWLLLSLAAALAGFLSKYNEVAALAIAPLATLIVYRKQPRRLLLIGGVGLAVAALLIFGLRLDRTFIAIIAARPKTNMLLQKDSPLALVGAQESAQVIFNTLGLALTGVALASLAAVAALRNRVSTLPGWKVALGASFALLLFLSIAMFTSALARYFLPVFAVAALLAGLGVALLSQALPARWRWTGWLVAAALVLPHLAQSWQLANVEYARPHSLLQASAWFETHAPQGARIIAEETPLLVWRRGYTGPPIYNVQEVDSLYGRDIADYQGEGIEYLIASSNKAGFFAHPEQADFTSELERVAKFGEGDTRGPELIVFKMPAYQQHVSYLWLLEPNRPNPIISLRGYDLPRTELSPGFVLEFTLYWLSVTKTDNDYEIHASLTQSGEDIVVAEYAGQPDGGNKPTSGWLGDMQFVRDLHRFVLPADLPPGVYELQVSLVNTATGEALAMETVDGEATGDTFSMGEITIE